MGTKDDAKTLKAKTAMFKQFEEQLKQKGIDTKQLDPADQSKIIDAYGGKPPEPLAFKHTNGTQHANHANHSRRQRSHDEYAKKNQDRAAEERDISDLGFSS